MKNSFILFPMVLVFGSSLITTRMAHSQIDVPAELQVFNESDITRTFDATAENRVRWQRDGSTFETTTLYNDVDAIQINPGQDNGWDFIDAGTGGQTENGTLAYSKYKIWTGSSYVYLDYRDTYYNTTNFPVGLDIELHFDENWKAFKPGRTDTVEVGDGGTINIWSLLGRSNPDQEGFTIPVTVDNNFSGGQVKVDNVDRSTPYNTDWSLNTTHSVAALSPQNVGGGNYLWCYWSDGGAQTHNVSVDGTSYSLTPTAKFVGTYITGPSILFKGEKGTYDSNPTCASGTCSYQWYKQYDGSEYWYTLGTAQTQQITMHSTPFTVKVEVTDDDYNQMAIDTKYVTAELDGPAADDSHNEAATVVGLHNYPNPFNPSTEISYALPEAGRVTVRIFNVLGEQVRLIAEGNRPAGRYTVRWNGENQIGQIMPSGIYFYRITFSAAESSGAMQVSTGRMNFVK